MHIFQENSVLLTVSPNARKERIALQFEIQTNHRHYIKDDARCECRYKETYIDRTYID